MDEGGFALLMFSPLFLAMAGILVAIGAAGRSAAGAAWRIRGMVLALGLLGSCFPNGPSSGRATIAALFLVPHLLAPLADGFRRLRQGERVEWWRFAILAIGPTAFAFLSAYVPMKLVPSILSSLLGHRADLGPWAFSTIAMLLLFSSRAFARLASLDPGFEPARSVEALLIVPAMIFHSWG